MSVKPLNEKEMSEEPENIEENSSQLVPVSGLSELYPCLGFICTSVNNADHVEIWSPSFSENENPIFCKVALLNGLGISSTRGTWIKFNVKFIGASAIHVKEAHRASPKFKVEEVGNTVKVKCDVSPAENDGYYCQILNASVTDPYGHIGWLDTNTTATLEAEKHPNSSIWQCVGIYSNTGILKEPDTSMGPSEMQKTESDRLRDVIPSHLQNIKVGSEFLNSLLEQTRIKLRGKTSETVGKLAKKLKKCSPFLLEKVICEADANPSNMHKITLGLLAVLDHPESNEGFIMRKSDYDELAKKFNF